MRMIAESEKLHGDDVALLRQPHVDRPQVEARDQPAVTPRVSAEAVLEQIAMVDVELAAVRALVDGREPTAREWEQVTARIDRVGRVAAQATRWARTLAIRAHVAQR